MPLCCTPICNAGLFFSAGPHTGPSPAPKGTPFGIHTFNPRSRKPAGFAIPLADDALKIPPTCAPPEKAPPLVYFAPDPKTPPPLHKPRKRAEGIGPVAGDGPGLNSPLQDSAFQPGLTLAPPWALPCEFLNPPLHFAPWPIRSPTLSPAAATGPIATFRSRFQKDSQESLKRFSAQSGFLQKPRS